MQYNEQSLIFSKLTRERKGKQLIVLVWPYLYYENFGLSYERRTLGSAKQPAKQDEYI